jgi:hypothetical protein
VGDRGAADRHDAARDTGCSRGAASATLALWRARSSDERPLAPCSRARTTDLWAAAPIAIARLDP